ncbi:MAG: N-acetylglucosamine kinase [Proteobacteria bacterium]|nr:N-acetylglucosamine kinase [Pseudomonadota bacterium]
MAADFFLGVDGGGTHCRVRLRDAQGALAAETKGGSANIFTDPVEAIANVANACDAAFAAAGLGLDAMARTAACFGLAGANMAGAIARVEAHPWPYQSLRIEHDGIIACVGAHGGEDGAIAAIGTGAVYVISLGGKLQTFGGWGFMLSDQGSGADLGRESLRRTLYAQDGIIDRTPFTDAVWAQFGHSMDKLHRFAEAAKPRDYGALTPLLLEHAERNDPVARFIVERGQTGVTLVLDHLVKLGAKRICIMGGLGQAYQKYFPYRFRPYFVSPRHDALDGALILAGGRVS